GARRPPAQGPTLYTAPPATPAASESVARQSGRPGRRTRAFSCVAPRRRGAAGPAGPADGDLDRSTFPGYDDHGHLPGSGPLHVEGESPGAGTSIPGRIELCQRNLDHGPGPE